MAANNYYTGFQLGSVAENQRFADESQAMRDAYAGTREADLARFNAYIRSMLGNDPNQGPDPILAANLSQQFGPSPSGVQYSSPFQSLFNMAPQNNSQIGQGVNPTVLQAVPGLQQGAGLVAPMPVLPSVVTPAGALTGGAGLFGAKKSGLLGP